MAGIRGLDNESKGLLSRKHRKITFKILFPLFEFAARLHRVFIFDHDFHFFYFTHWIFFLLASPNENRIR